MNKETRYKILSEIVDKPGDAYDLIETLREGQKLSEEAIELNKELSRERIKKLRHEKLIERKKIGWLIFAYIDNESIFNNRINYNRIYNVCILYIICPFRSSSN